MLRGYDDVAQHLVHEILHDLLTERLYECRVRGNRIANAFQKIVDFLFVSVRNRKTVSAQRVADRNEWL